MSVAILGVYSMKLGSSKAPVSRNVGDDVNPSNVAGAHVKHADGGRAARFETERWFGQERRTNCVDVFEKGGNALEGLPDIKWRQVGCRLAELEL